MSIEGLYIKVKIMAVLKICKSSPNLFTENHLHKQLVSWPQINTEAYVRLKYTVQEIAFLDKKRGK